MKALLSILVFATFLTGCASTPAKKLTDQTTQSGTATGHFCWVARPQVIDVTMYVAVDGIEAAVSRKNEAVKFAIPAGERKIKAGVKSSFGAFLAKKTVKGFFEPSYNYYFIWTDEWRPGGAHGGYVDMFLYKVTREDFEMLTRKYQPTSTPVE